MLRFQAGRAVFPAGHHPGRELTVRQAFLRQPDEDPTYAMKTYPNWGVFSRKQAEQLPEGEAHIVPCSEDGMCEPGHSWRATCRCDPGVLVNENRTVIVIHSPGTGVGPAAVEPCAPALGGPKT